MALIPLNLVYEDQVSEYVMLKLADKAQKFHVSNSYSEGGFGYIKRNIKGFNEGSKWCPFFVLTDLDKANCAPELIKEWLKEKQHPNLIFRIAIKEVESWLIADTEGFSKYLDVSKDNFPDDVEAIPDPKAELLRLAKRSNKRKIKEDILPKDEYAKIGPNYNERLGEFIFKHWNISRASGKSNSLRKTLLRLKEFKIHY